MSNFSLIDFIVGIAEEVISPNGTQEDPYDVNFTNHYIKLHEFEEGCKSTIKRKVPINGIIQDKKNKSLTINTDVQMDKQKSEKFKEYCDENKIDYTISRGKLKSIEINKHTKGVADNREWKK